MKTPTSTTPDPGPSELQAPATGSDFLTRVGLVGCSSTKLSRPAPARELYTSALFRKASEYAERTCDRWFVLSAKHGLVHPDTVVEPYDVKLARTSPTTADWSAMVNRQLEDSLADTAHPLLVTLAGQRYRTFLLRSAWPHDVPMRGLGIGEQLAWLTRALAADRSN